MSGFTLQLALVRDTFGKDRKYRNSLEEIEGERGINKNTSFLLLHLQFDQKALADRRPSCLGK